MFLTENPGKPGKNELIERCDALYIWHKDALYRMALRALSGDREWALRVLEECMMIAYRHIDKFDDENSEKTKAMLTAILQSVINRIYRETWKKMGVDDGYENPMQTQKDELFVNQVLVRNELSADLARHVDRLSRSEKELVFFRYFFGLSEKEMTEYFPFGAEEMQSRIFSVKQKIVKWIMEG